MLRVLDLYCKVAIFEPKLRKCTSRTDCTTKLRFSSWSCGSALRALDLHYKVAIFELELRKCTSRARLVCYKVGIFDLELRKCTSRS